MRGLSFLTIAAACAFAFAPAADAAVKVLPRGSSAIVIDAARDEYQDVQVRLTGASGRIDAELDASSAPLLRDNTSFLRVTSTRVAGRQVDDPLPPLAQSRSADGTVRLVVRVRVPGDAVPGVYRGSLRVSAAGETVADLPVTLNVWDVALPGRADASAFRTLFQITPQSYINAVTERSGVDPHDGGPLAGEALMRFLSEYRISPGDWGYGTPRSNGYVNGKGWWRRPGERMDEYGQFPFSTMRLPIDTQRATSPLTGLSPRNPEGWVPYLRRLVVPLWESEGWLSRSVVWGWDEPGEVLDREVIGRQACAVHEASGGTEYMVTASPKRNVAPRQVRVAWGKGQRTYTLAGVGGGNPQLWDGRGCNDVDVWVVLARRFYGTFATPLEQRAGIDASRELQKAIKGAGKRGASIWSYTYSASLTAGSPGYAAGEPETNPQVFMLWTAMEGMDGTLYGDGMMSYGKSDPFSSLAKRGQSVLVYPASEPESEPVSSLRLEGIRDGVEDANLIRMVGEKKGWKRVRSLMAKQQVFTIRGSKVQLACTMGCDLEGRTKFSWPRYRTDRGTALALDRLHRALLAELAAAPA